MQYIIVIVTLRNGGWEGTHIASIKEVAVAAGVSPTTASYALNNRPEVKEETKRKVREAAERIGYIPNRAAQAFRSGKTNTIAVMTSERIECGNTFSAEFFGVLSCARARHYDVLVKLVGASERDQAGIDRMLGGMMCDGYLLLGNHLDLVAKRILDNGLKGVLLSSHSPEKIAQVNVDGRKWIQEMTRLVFECGRMNPCYISFHLSEKEEKLRAEGFCAAMAERGLDGKARLLTCGTGGRRLKQAISEALGMGRDAIVCWNDVIALEVLGFLAEMGRRVPQDVAVTGFDDNGFMVGLNPTLTTVHQPFEEKGSVATEMLIDLIEDKFPKAPERRFVECSIMRRATL